MRGGWDELHSKLSKFRRRKRRERGFLDGKEKKQAPPTNAPRGEMQRLKKGKSITVGEEGGGFALFLVSDTLKRGWGGGGGVGFFFLIGLLGGRVKTSKEELLNISFGTD